MAITIPRQDFPPNDGPDIETLFERTDDLYDALDQIRLALAALESRVDLLQSRFADLS